MHSTRGMLRALVPALLLLLCAATQLAAQRWQRSVGGGGSNGETGNAVIEASNGDILTAGESNTLTGAPLAYVCRFDPDGKLLWQSVYDVAGFGNCVAHAIAEYPNGEVAVVGTTTDPGSGITHAFAMRIDAAGNLVWCTTLTTVKVASEGTGVVVAQNGDNVTTFAGDIILCGSRDATGGAMSEAMLARLDANGKMIWGKTYDFTATSGGQYARLFDVDEARIAPASGNVGEIIAVGACDDPSTSIPADVLYLRVDGKNGFINAAPQGAALFGSSAEDIGYSLQELRTGGYPGEVAIAGVTAGRPAPSSANEVFVVQAYDDPCSGSGLRASTYYGDNGPERDEALCVREITNAAVGTPGDVIVGGVTTFGAYFPSTDPFLQVFAQGSMTPVGPRGQYGGVGSDEARSVAEVQFAPNTPGFAFTGITTTGSFITPGNILDQYVVKTDNAFGVPCSTSTQTMSDVGAGWIPTCVTPTVNPVKVWTNVTLSTTVSTPSWPGNITCYTPFKPVAPEHASPDIIAGENELLARPNPVRRGMPLAIEVRSAENTTALITVSDALGREVQRNHTPVTAGTAAVSIPTAGWPLGTYTVAIACNGSLRTARVVVIDR